MELKEYICQYKASVEAFAWELGVTSACLWHYFNGTRKPTKKRAKLIEEKTAGRVTVAELRKESPLDKSNPQKTFSSISSAANYAEESPLLILMAIKKKKLKAEQRFFMDPSGKITPRWIITKEQVDEYKKNKLQK